MRTLPGGVTPLVCIRTLSQVSYRISVSMYEVLVCMHLHSIHHACICADTAAHANIHHTHTRVRGGLLTAVM